MTRTCYCCRYYLKARFDIKEIRKFFLLALLERIRYSDEYWEPLVMLFKRKIWAVGYFGYVNYLCLLVLWWIQVQDLIVILLNNCSRESIFRILVRHFIQIIELFDTSCIAYWLRNTIIDKKRLCGTRLGCIKYKEIQKLIQLCITLSLLEFNYYPICQNGVGLRENFRRVQEV